MDGAPFPVAQGPATVVPGPMLPDAWAARLAKAEQVYDEVLALPTTKGQDVDPELIRLKVAVADRVLARAKGSKSLELRQGDQTIRLRWSDGRPVVIPLHDPGQLPRPDDQADDDLEPKIERGDAR